MGIFGKKKASGPFDDAEAALEPSTGEAPSKETTRMTDSGTPEAVPAEPAAEATTPPPLAIAPEAAPAETAEQAPAKEKKRAKKKDGPTDEEFEKRLAKMPTPKIIVPWRQRVTLSSLMLWTVLSGILLAG